MLSLFDLIVRAYAPLSARGALVDGAIMQVAAHAYATDAESCASILRA